MTKTKRWLVREVDQWVRPRSYVAYSVYVGRRPYLSKRGNWVGSRECFVAPSAVRALLPKEYHLKPGGGPVELPE